MLLSVESLILAINFRDRFNSIENILPEAVMVFGLVAALQTEVFFREMKEVKRMEGEALAVTRNFGRHVVESEGLMDS